MTEPLHVIGGDSFSECCMFYAIILCLFWYVCELFIWKWSCKRTCHKKTLLAVNCAGLMALMTFGNIELYNVENGRSLLLDIHEKKKKKTRVRNTRYQRHLCFHTSKTTCDLFFFFFFFLLAHLHDWPPPHMQWTVFMFLF